MADLVSKAAIKDYLAECPICAEHFDEERRIPRRIPCTQSICQPCLEKCSRGNTVLDCPMCRDRHYLPPGGVKSLPKETVILKTLDYLKIQKGLHLPCTDCPDKETAQAQCDNCGTFLCPNCVHAHKRNSVTKDHTVNSFDQMKGQPVQSVRRPHQCGQHQLPLQFYCCNCNQVICVSCTVVEHKGHSIVSVDAAHHEKLNSTKDMLVKVEERTKNLRQLVSNLQSKINNFKLSQKVARDDINRVFEDLFDDLRHKRTTLLSDVDEKSAKNLKLIEEALHATKLQLTNIQTCIDYSNQVRTKADKVEDLQILVSSEASLNSMLKKSVEEIPFDRTGVTFVKANVKHLRDSMKVAGMVRTVTFYPTDKSHGVQDSAAYTAIVQEPAEVPAVTEMDWRMPDTEITSPSLEWDPSTAKSIIGVSESVITNTPPSAQLPLTECRIRNARSCLASRPLMVSRGQRCLYGVNLGFSIKQLTDGLKLIQEIALTPSPEDAVRNQNIGLSVFVLTCIKHKQKLCLQVNYNKKRLNHLPVTLNRVGESYDLQLLFLLDGANDKILVINAADNTVYSTVTDVEFDKPMWVMMYVCDPTTAEVRGELISGHKVKGTFANYNLQCLVTAENTSLPSPPPPPPKNI
ncbi:E3 ubiquitin-protein ligase TRIM33-like [Haliotis rubra]|uniref:E3 ubiquitin-protein ligase TRIM33-like n=1 Tax=Haliotis rubra TaxID=36100 RepID=UPI001EE61591|nr:E3 ubiquitin-protein ligase TRIM33-like [Haliotis rubra]